MRRPRAWRGSRGKRRTSLRWYVQDRSNTGQSDRRMTLGSGADQIDLYYFGPAHTSGDSFVVFPAIRAMHAGDAFANKGFPLVDMPNGGSAVQYGQTLAKAAATIK